MKGLRIELPREIENGLARHEMVAELARLAQGMTDEQIRDEVNQQAKGLGKQLGGKVQKTVGDIRDDAEKQEKRRDGE